MRNKILKSLFWALAIPSFLLISLGFIMGESQTADSSNIPQIDTISQSQVVSEFAPEAETVGHSLAKVLTDAKVSGSFDLTDMLRGLLGIIVILAISYLFSSNKKAINWKIIIIGLAIQLAFALGILYLPPVQWFFEFVGKLFVAVLEASRAGTTFLMGHNLMDSTFVGFVFAFNILPTIIFFSAISSILFYWGIIQKVVKILAWGMVRLLNLSGVESLSLAGNIFLGQTESPLMIKPYLERLNQSEFFLVMVGGMATLAGGVLAAYIGLLGGGDPALELIFAKHLITASVMAAPGAVVISKMLIPQTENISKKLEMDVEKDGDSILGVISKGTVEGMKLAVNVAAMLLVFIAFIALFNIVLGKIGSWTNLNEIIAANTRYGTLSLQFLLGYAISPLMWLIGVPTTDIALVGQLVGEKTVINEFVGYISLSQFIREGLLQPKSIIMSVYLLCGFANFSSVGIQIGGIGFLAPGKRKLLAKYGMKALLAGALTAILSATLMGILLG